METGKYLHQDLRALWIGDKTSQREKGKEKLGKQGVGAKKWKKDRPQRLETPLPPTPFP